jgi:hypothetical protein
MNLALARHQRAVLLDAGLHANHRGVLGDRVKYFFARQHNAHGSTRFLRQRHGDRLDFRIHFAAVAAAEVRHDNAHFGDRYFKNIGELGAHDEGILGRRPDGDAPAGLDGRDTSVRLEKAMLCRRQRERVLENMVGFSEAFVNIAAIEREVGANVGAFDRFDLSQIGETGSWHFDRIVHQGRARFER